MRRAALALAVLPLALAACGGGSTSSSVVALTPAASVTQAAKKSAAATSEHVQMDATTSVQGQKVVLNGEGDFDDRAVAGAMTMHANVGGLDLQIEEVLSKTALYMKSPVLAAGLPAGKTWVKLDLAKVGQARGVDLGSLLSQSPGKSFEQLQASAKVTQVGDETIGGTETTHYRGRIDAAKLPASLRKLDVQYRPYDIWIGKDGYVRRTRMGYTAAGQTVAMTMNFSDFGKNVSVTVPPAAETADGTTGIDSIGG